MDMQETWLLGLGWDDEFPDELRNKCQEWFRELPELPCVEVPRCYRVTGQQPRSQGIFPILSAGREKTLASAGHVPPYTLKSWV